MMAGAYVIANAQTGKVVAKEPTYAAALAWQLCGSFPGQYAITQEVQS